MTVKAEQVEEMLNKGITKYAYKYNVDATRVQLLFLFNAQRANSDEIVIKVAVDQVAKETVKVSNLIGINVYNPFIKKGISDLLKRLATDNKIAQSDIILMAVKSNTGFIDIWLGNRQNYIQKLKQSQLTI